MTPGAVRCSASSGVFGIIGVEALHKRGLAVSLNTDALSSDGQRLAGAENNGKLDVARESYARGNDVAVVRGADTEKTVGDGCREQGRLSSERCCADDKCRSLYPPGTRVNAGTPNGAVNVGGRQPNDRLAVANGHGG